MKPTSLVFHSEEQLFSEKDESSESFDGLSFNTLRCLFLLAPHAEGVGDIHHKSEFVRLFPVPLANKKHVF